MRRRSFFNMNTALLVISLMLTLSSCGSDGDGDGDDGAPPENDYKPSATNNSLNIFVNSEAGTENQVDVSVNDKIGENGSSGDDYSLLADPANGTVTEIEDGLFEYIPNTDYLGADSFKYRLTDNKGESADAKVTITIKEQGLTEEDFENMDPNFPSFVSVINTTPEGKIWVKQENMSDEFDSWDNTKWKKSTWNYGVPVYMVTDAANSNVSDGNLWIKATLNESNPEGRWFQTARIHSKTKISYPMYTEASIKAAHISAFNTYWLNNGDINNRDEIDIIENNPKPSCGCKPDFPLVMNSQYFQADETQTPGEIRDEDNYHQDGLSDANPLKGVKWNEDYHTFGVWWKDSKNIQFYLDGEPAGSVTVGHHRDGSTYENREFTRDLEIIFDLWTFDADWIGGLALKEDLADNTINTMKIDWVRTWVLDDE